MRNKYILVLPGLLLLGLLSACGPTASAATTALQNMATGGSPINNVPSAAIQQQGTQPSPSPSVRTLSVSGTGRATLTPDIAYINIGVHTENADVGEALATNKANTQKVVDAIKAAGVDEKDIQTTNFNVYPMQQYGSNGQIIETKYAVDNTVYVTVRNLDKLGDLLDATVRAGANNINGIQFDVADKTSALSDARKAAVKNAQELATELAGAAGVQLGPIQTINISSTSQPTPVYSAKGLGGGMAADTANVPISSGQLILTVDVNIVYEIQ